VKKLIAFALVLTAFAPTVAAQTAASFTGKWEGTFTRQAPDGTATGNPSNVTFDFVQKGKVLTGTAGPSGQPGWSVDKGVIAAGKATFEVQQPNGPLFKFTLSIVKGRLAGDLAVERDGTVMGKAKVDAAKAAAAAKK
jgi:hypothetical protein